MYDTLMRLPVLVWVSFSATIVLAGSIQYVNTTPIDSIYAIHLAMLLSTVSFLFLLAATVIFRTRPTTKAIGLEPRFSALAGSFLMNGIALFPRHDLSLSAEVIATLLTIIGSIGSVIALSQLGRSFSVMAESRALVTSGPYRFVRHPLYLAEEIALVGLFMQFASIWTALLFAAQIAFQIRRMHNEEVVLSITYAEYEIYRRNTARLIPGIY